MIQKVFGDHNAKLKNERSTVVFRFKTVALSGIPEGGWKIPLVRLEFLFKGPLEFPKEFIAPILVHYKVRTRSDNV